MSILITLVFFMRVFSGAISLDILYFTAHLAVEYKAGSFSWVPISLDILEQVDQQIELFQCLAILGCL